jgi:hypothetical protein
MPSSLDHTSPAQKWIDAGLALPTSKGKNVSFEKIAFSEAEANRLVHLTGKGALSLDREAKKREPPSPN